MVYIFTSICAVLIGKLQFLNFVVLFGAYEYIVMGYEILNKALQ